MNIFCYAPYSNFHPLHGYWEITILHALRLRGANIKYYLCDLDSDYCMLYHHTTADCIECKQKCFSIAKKMSITPAFISKYINKKDKFIIHDWLATLHDKNLPHATFGKYPIGKYVLSSFQSFRRFTEYNPNNPEHVHI